MLGSGWSAAVAGAARVVGRAPLADLPGSPVREVFTAVREAAQGSEAIGAVRGALADAFAQHRRPRTRP